jgi:hypothetical protein
MQHFVILANKLGRAMTVEFYTPLKIVYPAQLLRGETDANGELYMTMTEFVQTILINAILFA